MKQGSPPKCMTQKKKRKRGGTDWAGSKAKRRREARKKLQQEKTLVKPHLVEMELEEGEASPISCGIDQIVECRDESIGSPSAVVSNRLRTMSDQQRTKRAGGRACLGNMNVQSWLEREFEDNHLQIAVEESGLNIGCGLKEVRNAMDCRNVISSSSVTLTFSKDFPYVVHL